MSHLLIWSDKNLDGRTQPDEIMTWPADAPYSEAIRFNSDMSFLMRGVKMPKPTVLPNGVPVWPADAKQELITDKPGAGNTVAAGNDWVIRMGGDDKKNGVFGFRQGQRLWDYPFQPHAQITTDPSMIVLGQRFISPPFSPREGQAGMTFDINGEMGSIYLMTTDGLFIQDVGGDLRVTPPIGTKYPIAKRGMVIENASFV